MHYTKEEIAARGIEVCRHLIFCADCRRLAEPLSADALMAVFSSDASSSRFSEAVGTSADREGVFSRIFGGGWLRFSIAAASLAMIVAALLFVAIGGRLVHVPDVALNEPQATSANPVPFDKLLPRNASPDNPSERDDSRPAPQNRLGQSRGATHPAPAPRRTRDHSDSRVSPTRGGVVADGRSALPCSQTGTTNGVTTSNGLEGVILSWPRIKDAVSWHMYLSDDNEVLVAEFDSDAELSYEVKGPLDANKIYVWKVVYTLGDGRRVVGVSARFGERSLAAKPSESGVSRGASAARCQD